MNYVTLPCTALICTALACTSLYLTAPHCKSTRLNRQCFVILPQDNLPGADIVKLKFLPPKQTELNSTELFCASLYGASKSDIPNSEPIVGLGVVKCAVYSLQCEV